MILKIPGGKLPGNIDQQHFGIYKVLLALL